jgi:L-asparaginase
VELLCADGVAGIVLAGPGNGTLSQGLEQAEQRAQQAGVAVWRASRCSAGGIVGLEPGGLASAGSAAALSPAQARVELTLTLLEQRARVP